MLRKFNNWLAGFGIIAVIAFYVLLLIGYVLNIIDFFGALSGEVGALFIARIVGFFVPIIGAILGWFF